MYLLASLGFVLLFAGGELLVRGAVSVSRRAGISPLLIGMTVVAFCTSAPELVVSIGAARAGQPALAVGNVIGSNIANILLILGVAALVSPMRFDVREVRRDTFVLLGASTALVIVASTGMITPGAGMLFVGSLLAYIAYSYWTEARGTSPVAVLHEHEAEEFSDVTDKLWLGLLNLGLGLGGLVAGSRMLITGAGDIARSFGISEAVIGLSLVAIGTSLPELAASLVAALRGHSDVAVGNVLGSNVMNILLILGVTSFVAPVPVDPQMAQVDAVLALVVALGITPLLIRTGRIGRVAGASLLVLYAAYITVLYVGWPVVA